MRGILSIFSLCIFLVACSSTATQLVKKSIGTSQIIPLNSFSSDCKQDLLCEYLSWFKKTPLEIANLQKEYGISYRIPPLQLDNNTIDIKQLETLVNCNQKQIEKIILDGNKVLFACKVSLPKEFRYGIYFGYIDNNKLNLRLIDSGGGLMK